MTDTFAGRTAPWRRIEGAAVFEEAVSTREMLSRAQLDNWNVRTVKMQDIISKEYTVSENQFVTVRDTEYGPSIIGAVKSRYNPLQNEYAFAWADAILDGGGQWDTAGSFNNGSKVFGSLHIDEDSIVVDRNGLNDRVNLYLLVSNSHDGSLPLQSSITPVRVRCQNTLNLALNAIARSDVPQTFKIRHTMFAEAKVDVAREALRLTFRYAEDFNKLANDMYGKKVSADGFNSILNYLYPQPVVEGEVTGSKKAALTKWTATIDLLNDIRVSETNEGIADTAWGVYNILTERIDWFRKGDNTNNHAIAASGFSLAVNEEKNRILRTVLAATA